MAIKFYFTLATLAIFNCESLSWASPSILTPDNHQLNLNGLENIPENLVLKNIPPPVLKDVGNVQSGLGKVNASSKRVSRFSKIPYRNLKMFWYHNDKGGYSPAFFGGGPTFRETDLSTVFVLMYNILNQNAGAKYYLTDKEGILNEIECGVKTMILIHGFTGSAKTSWCEAAKTEMFRKYYCNVWCLDWEYIAAGPWYDYAAEGACNVGKYLGELLAYLHNSGCISLDLVRIWGHSLGAHVAGCAGSSVYEKCGEKIGRMVGSDPAGPFFQEHDTAGRLDPTDAKFVQSVHCDYGMFGCNWRCGHADFYMNGGSAQPGCNMASDLTGCSHNYCKKVAVDSIRNEGIYQSCECNDVDFTNAVNPTTATMGYHCSDQTTGCQCVWTSYVPPFLV